MKATELLGKAVTIRNTPTVATGNDSGGRVAPYGQVDYTAIVPDANPLLAGNPEYQWLKLPDGRYVNYIYPPNGLRFKLEETGPVLKHTILVMSDGSLVIDGVPY